MIDLYTWATPNGHKIAIMLEEIAAPYKVVPINIITGDQLKPDFLKLNPNNKIPVIVDHDAPGGRTITVFESGAILLYLAEKSGKLLPKDLAGRFAVLEWLFFQVGGVGPMLGQAHYFRKYAVEQVKHAIDRYTNEANRLYRVLNGQLGRGTYLAGDYSIADIACFPWVRSHEMQGQDLNEFPNVKRWFEAINQRPAVQKGLTVLADKAQNRPLEKEEEAVLWGDRQRLQR
ncbi:MAG: glutathione S-transferase family protein [Candidatus Eiseniibacteriota bacterium]